MSDLARLLVRAQPVDTCRLGSARQVWEEHRKGYGLKGAPDLLTPPSANAKYAKTAVPVYGLSLAPDRSSGAQVCRYSTPECRAGCVAFAGKGDLPFVIKVRTCRTTFLAEHPDQFVTLLCAELDSLKRKFGRKRFGVRLNGFSDLPWERIVPWLFVRFSSVQFYDYTKWPQGSRDVPRNYHLTYSVSERTTDATVRETLASGSSVAVVFSTVRGHPLPAVWNGAPVIDGDKSDARFKDPAGVVVGLRAKGRMRTGSWGMVRTA